MVFGIALDLVVFQKTDKQRLLLVVLVAVAVAVGFVANRKRNRRL